MRNIRKNQWLTVSILSVAALLQIQMANGQAEMYRNISLAEFSQRLEAKDFLLINVHVPYQGEIPGTDLLLPYHAVEKQKDRLPPARDTQIVVYCLTGPMGYAAAADLVKLGYTEVFHFEGGMLEWVRSGRQLMYRDAK